MGIKTCLRDLLHRVGVEVLHRDDDPIGLDLISAREERRLECNRPESISKIAKLSYLQSVLKDRSITTVIDVGANRGQFAQELRRLGFNGHIHSFEPAGALYAELAKEASAEKMWQVYNFALGDITCSRELTVTNDDTFSSLHSLQHSATSLFGDMVDPKLVETVLVKRLDDVAVDIIRDSARRTLLKIDTQGHDLAVLCGATKILEKIEAVMVELSFLQIYENAPSFDQVIRFLEENGFVCGGIFPIAFRNRDLALVEADGIFVRSHGTSM